MEWSTWMVFWLTVWLFGLSVAVVDVGYKINSLEKWREEVDKERKRHGS